MITFPRCILAALALGATIVARAESAPARSVVARPVGLILTVLDSDGDGILSAREIAVAPLTLATLDINEDGKISADEWRATNIEGRTIPVRHGSAAFNVVLTLDANHDGDIQSMEIANAVASLQRLDLNGDGKLTRDELRPMMVARNRS